VKRILSRLGFRDIDIVPKERSDEIIRAWNVGPGVETIVFSAYIRATKPMPGE
jgi:hypothetical protein